jgi:ABC-2 type transport system permease protein
LRTPDFVVGAVTIPVILYVIFGLPNASSLLPGGSRVGAATLVSLCSYGVVSLAIFTFGEYLAKERGRGWIRTLIATPFPTSIHLSAKTLTATVHAAIIAIVMGAIASWFGGVVESPMTWLAYLLTMVAGVVVFSTLGFAIAYLAKPSAAVVISNVLFLPLAFASGFFMPLSELPEIVGKIAVYLPTFHFGQLAYRVFLPEADIAAWTGVATRPVWVHVAWIVGSAALFAVVALVAAKREAVSRRG